MKRLKYFFLISATYFLSGNIFAQVPDIVKVDKVSGTVRELVTISGSGFSQNKADLSVFFGGAKGQILNSTEFLIEVLAPAGANYQNISVTNLVSKSTGFAKPYFNLAFNGKEFDPSRFDESLVINEDQELFDICNCDFNGDGLIDIATTNNTDEAGATSITVYRNITQPTDFDVKFQSINEVNLNTGKGARNITCGDLNGDGKPELIVGKGGGNADRIYVFKNKSTTGIAFDPFTTILLSENVTSSTTRKLKIHDLDRDGKPDIIMTDQGMGNVFIFGNKSENGNINFPSEARQIIPTSAGSLVGLDVADFNNDGKPEIICNSDKSEIFSLLNESVAGTINMAAPQTKSISGSNLVNLRIGDLDNDGDKDIVVTNLVNNIYVLINEGNENSYSFGTPKYVETGRAPWGLDLGDLNGDGLVDIVIGTTDAGDKLTALINTTTGTTLSYSPFSLGNSDISFNLSIADFNGDAKPDLGYINRQANTIVIFRNMHCVLPDILPKNPPAVCSNKPVKLRTTPAQKVSYIWTNTTTDQIIDGEAIANITEAGTYNVSIISTGDGCETISEELTLIDGGDNLPPSVSIISPGVVCEGNNFVLKGQAVDGVNYFWSTPSGEIFSGIELAINNSTIEDGGRYGLVLESAGCRTDPVFEVVEISSVPEMEISLSAGELFCEGTSNELSVPFIPNAVYEWKFNNSIIPGVVQHSYSTTNSGSYNVSVINAFGCTGNSNTITIKQVKQPVASFNEITSSCLNKEIQFENTSTYDETEQPVFHWDFGDGTFSTDKNPRHTYVEAGNYKVILQAGYDNTNCSNSTETAITVAAFVALEIKADGNPIDGGIFNLCEGSSAVLSVNARDGQVEWSTGETTANITIDDLGIYTVISGKNTGCSSSDEIEVKLVDNVELEITSGSQSIEGGESVQLSVAGAETYLWEPVESLDNPTIPDPIATPLETTEYTVKGSNIYGCYDIEMITVFVDEAVNIPVDAAQAFTPNGDGQNDVWEIKNLEVFESCPIRIFNRRGQNVYEASTYNNDWDGYLNGIELPEGAYYYILTCGTSDVHAGNITLIR